MSKEPATTWGDMASERDSLIDAIIANMEWKEAMDRYNNTAYKGDALVKVDLAKQRLDAKMRVANVIIDKYRR